MHFRKISGSELKRIRVSSFELLFLRKARVVDSEYSDKPCIVTDR